MTVRRHAVAVAFACGVAVVGVASAAVTVLNDPASVGQPAERVRILGPTVGGCEVFPSDNAWNTEIAGAPLHARAAPTPPPEADAITAAVLISEGLDGAALREALALRLPGVRMGDAAPLLPEQRDLRTWVEALAAAAGLPPF